jgi:BirA family transcriptional regulator, biotin operon repressor / biotin---[acetyl-CoA-carboxylase] ligase
VIERPRTIELERCDSTQDELRLLARAGAPAFTVVRADVQDAGRGRRGRVWQTRPGAALLASVLLRPRRAPSELAALAIVGGIAAARVAGRLGVDARVRWPNDVVVAGRKLVGVLPEASRGRVVLGIGVNVNQTTDELPTDTAKPPTSLRVELGREVERAPLLAAILLELERGYDEWSAPYLAR